MFAALWLLGRPRRHTPHLFWLQLTASAVATLLAAAVAMLARAFLLVPSPEPGYRVLAVGLAGLLLVPLVTLGTAAARLAARSRDDRLATLRLLGVSSRRVRAIAVAEVTVIAALGVAAGTALSAVLPFVLGTLTIHGTPLSPADLWLPAWLAAAIPPSLVLIAAASALLGLRLVTLSPLGVRTRQNAPRLSWLRFAAAVLVVGGASLVSQLASPDWGVTAIIVALTLSILAIMAVLGIAGPFVVALIARRRASRTADGATLIAMRGIAGDPKAAWRQVSAVALTSFVLIPGGTLTGYLDVIQNSASRAIMSREQLLLFADARTMLIAVVAISFLIVACQIAVTQSAAVLEHGDLYIALDRIGIPVRELTRSRRIAVMTPALVAVLGSSVAAFVLGFTLIALILVMAPLFALGVVILLATGVLFLRLGISATTPVLRRVLAAPARGE